MRAPARLLAFLTIFAAAACSDARVLEPTADRAPGVEPNPAAHAGAPHIAVMSRNMYIGADVDAVIAALETPGTGDDMDALLAAIETLFRTDYDTRAGALADEVARTGPDVIGLQEVYFLSIDLGIPGVPPILHDFLPTFLSALADRGLNYVEAAQVIDTDATLPGIRLIDHDVILVNPDRVDVQASDGQLFNANIGDPGIGVAIVRGWTSIWATIDGMELQVINTHLESGPGPQLAGLRALQALELVPLASTDVPVVLLGDLNDEVGSPMYQVLAGAGFEDVWTELRPRQEGLTCCHASDLSNAVAAFDQRIDYVMARGLGHPRSGLKGRIGLTGVHPRERVDGPFYPIWASDHAGVVATIVVPPAHGLRR